MLSHRSVTFPTPTPLPKASGHILTAQPQFLHETLPIKEASKAAFAELRQSFSACKC